MKTATKRDLVVKISNETGMTQQQVFDVIQKTLDTITQTLASGDEVVLRNFGSFQVKETKQKKPNSSYLDYLQYLGSDGLSDSDDINAMIEKCRLNRKSLILK